MFHYFQELPSTSDKLSQMLPDNSSDFTVVYTFNQTSGKGYLESKWESEKDKNLTFSFVISPKLSLPLGLAKVNFWVVSVLHEFLSAFCVGHSLKIKWPNDIFLNGKKICGVLIENRVTTSVNTSIIGIGINVNQVKFEGLPFASSLFRETSFVYDLEEMLERLIDLYRLKFDQLKDESHLGFYEYYNFHLYRKHEHSLFERNGENFYAKVLKANEYGELELLLDDYSKLICKHKEVRLIL